MPMPDFEQTVNKHVHDGTDPYKWPDANELASLGNRVQERNRRCEPTGGLTLLDGLSLTGRQDSVG